MKCNRFLPLLFILAAARSPSPSASSRQRSARHHSRHCPFDHRQSRRLARRLAARPLLKDRNAAVRYRPLCRRPHRRRPAVAAVAALLKDRVARGRGHAAFALGEIESINAADHLVAAIKIRIPPTACVPQRRGCRKDRGGQHRVVKSRALSAAVKDVLEKNSGDRETIILALTAATVLSLRTRSSRF